MPRIDSLTEESWRLIVSDSNQAAMRKSHQYPRYEGQFLEDCCTFQQPECTPSCFCRRVGCRGVWTLRPDVKFQDLLSHYCNLWLRGAQAFIDYVENDSRSGMPKEWKNAVLLLREIRRRWSNWDEHGNSLPLRVNEIRRCYFCRVPLDKREGSVKDKLVLCRAEAPLFSPERLRTKALEISR